MTMFIVGGWKDPLFRKTCGNHKSSIKLYLLSNKPISCPLFRGRKFIKPLPPLPSPIYSSLINDRLLQIITTENFVLTDPGSLMYQLEVRI